MSSIFLLLIVAIVVLVVITVLKAKAQGGAGDEVWPFYAKKPLSQPEQILYFRLIQALPEHIILAQVQLSRLLGVKKGNNPQAWFNRINRMSTDFVVCNKDSSIVAVIELDDATHQREDRQIADAKKDKALASADVRIVRYQSQILPPSKPLSFQPTESYPHIHAARSPGWRRKASQKPGARSAAGWVCG